MRREPDRPVRRRDVARASSVLALAAALAVGAACASTHPFHARFESGDYAAAARTFAADSALHAEPRALWRAALIHARPGSETYDPVTARARLARLLEVAPESEFAPPGVVLLGLLGEVARMREAVVGLRARVDSLASLRAADAAADAAWAAALQRARPGDSAYDPQAARTDLSALIERHPRSRFRPAAEAVLALLDEVARGRAAVAALQRQLDELKAVDLEDPP